MKRSMGSCHVYIRLYVYVYFFLAGVAGGIVLEGDDDINME